MVPGHVVLRHFTFVDLLGFGQEIGREALLQQRITFVFLVGEDGADGAG